MDKMTDAEVRAELERIDPIYERIWVWGSSYDTPRKPDALRLLAESQQALGEIEKCAQVSYKGYMEMFPIFPDSTSEDDAKRMTILGSFQEIIKIARKHYKGGK